jgi:cell division GTPase FtsZ
MKLVVVGVGQCGGRVADQFNYLESKARRHRKMSIVSETFAVNTDTADLSGLSHVKSDYNHRILIGNRKISGHGVGKKNGVGARAAMEDGEKIVGALRSSSAVYEADALLLTASAAGGTGSGGISILSEILKDRFKRKPVYALVILPFEHEEKREARTAYNVATCLKAVYSVADAVFLVDNQRYIEKDSSLNYSMNAINQLIAEPFYDLLCAGEAKKSKYVGARVLDAGDIISTLQGSTTLGYGVSKLPVFKLPFQTSRDFRKKNTETSKGIHAMDQALSNLSIECNPRDSASALFLVSAPHDEMSMNMINELSEYLAEAAPDAEIRYGDYPRGDASLKVTVMLSKLESVDKVRKYYDSIPSLIQKREEDKKKNKAGVEKLLEAAGVVPSLFSADNGNG